MTWIGCLSEASRVASVRRFLEAVATAELPVRPPGKEKCAPKALTALPCVDNEGIVDGRYLNYKVDRYVHH